MLKNCDESICKPLEIIFWSCLQNVKFPSEWKKANVVSVFKKNKKQVKNYWTISLLPVSSKIFERLLYDSMFTFSLTIVQYPKTNQGLNQVTLVQNNSCQLCINSTNLLITAMRFDLCSSK